MGDNNTKDLTTGQVIPNPTGKGGFAEHPENRSPGGLWNPDMTFSFQYKKFNNMDVEEFKTWKETNPKHTMVQELAWGAVFKARTEHKYLTEVANRTEGMPKQSTDLTSAGEKIEGMVIYRPEKKNE